ncbi:MAG: HipA domain-containing protein, partial [Flavobacteriales bacterium]|nr:HipA domain-containing protein [Flavobacteriales bacterium]
NDMHLKNYSMILSEVGWVLAPFYDFINVKILLPKDREDMALLLGGKKENFNRRYFDRLGEILKLNNKQITSVYQRLDKWLPEATQLIDDSFLESDRKKAYKALIAERTLLFTKGSPPSI